MMLVDHDVVTAAHVEHPDEPHLGCPQTCMIMVRRMLRCLYLLGPLQQKRLDVRVIGGQAFIVMLQSGELFLGVRDRHGCKRQFAHSRMRLT